MSQNVLVTGTGREMALGFAFVRRYLEQGDTVFASVRKPSEALEKLKESYPDKLHILTMDIGKSDSVKKAAEEAASIVPCIDLIINNAVTVSPDCSKEFMDVDLDTVADAYDVAAVGPLRVIQAFMPLLKKSSMTALIVNITSEAGSIGACYRTNMLDYAMSKAALNMATKTLQNTFKGDDRINIICVHPGWNRTNEGNAKAPLIPYDNAETMRLLFEERRNIKDGDLFITWEGKAYPW